MTVKELMEKLSKLDPNIECFTIDDNEHLCEIVDACVESNDAKEFAYIEINSIGPVELY
jgi:hypothetical protein